MSRFLLILSEGPNLFDRVRATLRLDSRIIDSDDEVHCDGSAAPLTNIYPVEMTAGDWADRQSADSGMPDPTFMQTLIFECRSATWVAEVGALLAKGSETPIWFVDSADTAWPADRVDTNRVVLD